MEGTTCMQISSLTLRNIGAYYGGNTFDFTRKSRERNVILFGGKNGAGKTTLLESFRVALFGPLAFGQKTESETYQNRIRTLLNRKALAKGENLFQIILSIRQIDNYERAEYKLKRSWELKDNKLKESFMIESKGSYLSEREVEIFQTRLREEMPPHLFELCLFDGEEISRIVSDGKLADYLLNTSKVLFSLDLFENLEKDLQEFQEIQSQRLDTSVEEKQLHAVEEQISTLEHEIEEIEKSLQNNAQKLNDQQSYLDQVKKEFEIHGGLQNEKRNQLLSTEKEIEERRKANTEIVKNFVSVLLPLYLVKDLLSEVDKQMEKEKTNEVLDYFTENLTQSRMDALLEAFSEDGVKIANISDKQEFVNAFLKGFRKVFIEEHDVMIHKASAKQRGEVLSVLHDINKVNASEYVHLFEENNELLLEAQALRKKVEENDQATDLRKYVFDIENWTKATEQSKLEKEQLEVLKSELIVQLEQKNEERKKIKEKLSSSERSESSLLLSSNIIELSKKFSEIQLQKKLKQVEIEASNMLQQLFRKKNYMKEITIDHRSFEVKLFDHTQEEIVKERLSAGEKEILMISIIWAMFTCSGRRLPFVFDTLLGRLDSEHKNSMIEKFIPSCGEQVIILATDSEINPELYSLLKPNISRSYTLEYNTIEKQIEIFPEIYFDFLEVELV